jgi:hypothetical protein
MKQFLTVISIIAIVVSVYLFFSKKVNELDYKTKIELYQDSAKIKQQSIDSLELIRVNQLKQLDSINNVLVINKKIYEKERTILLNNLNNVIKLNASQQLQLLSTNINSIPDSTINAVSDSIK